MEGHRISGKDRPGRQEMGVQGVKKKAELGGCEMIITDGQESTPQGGGKSRGLYVTTVRKEREYVPCRIRGHTGDLKLDVKTHLIHYRIILASGS